jgi:peptide/nickel transport system permease protein
MIAYITRRLFLGVLVLVLATFLVFLIMRLLPSDPLTLFLAQSEIENVPAENRRALQQEYGLDKPLPLQYLSWISNVLHGDLGKSIFYKNNVGTLIAERVPVSLCE